MARKRYEEHREYWRKRKAKEAREPNSPQKREEDRRKYAEEMEARRKREEAAKMEPAPFHNATALIPKVFAGSPMLSRYPSIPIVNSSAS